MTETLPTITISTQPARTTSARLPEGMALSILTTVSPYLWQPVRTLAQARRDRAYAQACRGIWYTGFKAEAAQ